MRVLWLTRAQLPAATGAASMINEGWQEGLRRALEQHEPDLELGIVSWGRAVHEPFSAGNATYYSLPMSAPVTRAGRIVKAWQMNVVSPPAVREAVALGRRFKPDIVHLHGTEHFLGLAALELPYPCVATLQGMPTVLERFMLDPMPVHDVARSVATRGFVRGDSLLHRYVGMRRAARVERRVIHGLTYFMGQTDWDRKVLRLLNPNATYFRCSRALQAPFYERCWRGGSASRVTLVCTSSPMPYKGVDILIEAVHLLAEAGYDNLELRIIGAFPQSQLWPMLSRLVDSRSVTELVTWLGPLDAEQIADELSGASLFVLPSHIENESNALIEAMLVGLPCVAAAVGGIPSIVHHGLDGLLYHDRDPFALAGAIADVLDDPTFARSLGDNARAQALSRFDPGECAHRTRVVYNEVLARAGSH